MEADHATFRSLTPTEIFEIVKAAIANAVRTFECLSCADPRDIPEQWIGAAIATGFHQVGGCYVVPETVIHQLGRELGFTLDEHRTGKVDLAVYGPGPFPGRAPPLCLIEIKSPRTTWNSLKRDCHRLRQVLAQARGQIPLGILAYASGPMDGSKHATEKNRLAVEAGVSTDRVEAFGPYRPMRSDLAHLAWYGAAIRIDRPTTIERR